MKAASRLGGHRLRRRLATALVALTALSALILSVVFLGMERYVEQATLGTLLEREMSYRVRANTVPAPGDMQGETLRFYRPALGGAVPPHTLTDLAPGQYNALRIGEQQFFVLVQQVGPEDVAYLSYSDSAMEARERLLFAALFATLALISLAAFWLSARLARQTLAPLDGLVANLHALDPELRQQRLAPLDRDSELAVITEALNAYMQRLDELVERERAFAAAASHELRTPLAVIRGAAEVLEASQPSAPLARIQRAALAAQQDLDALLWLSRAGEAPAAETLPLHQRLKALCAAQIDTEAIDWQLQPCTVTAPPGAVAIIVSNLLRNALRAAPKPGGVRVFLTADTLTVDDDGPGVPPDELPQVFAPRTRGHDGGTGMGLYIAATLAARLGWRLSLENRAGGGARAALHFH
ncbi:MAG: HAMP domain-containing sensor histidine kinase [Pseudomonadota bacterium]